MAAREKLLRKAGSEQFDDTASRDLDPWTDVSMDREIALQHAEAHESVAKRRGFGKNILVKLGVKDPEYASVNDNAYTASLAEQGRDGWGVIPDHEMDIARAARNRIARSQTRAGRKENERRADVKQQVHADRYPDLGDTNGW